VFFYNSLLVIFIKTSKLTTAEELSNDALLKEKEENEKNKNKIFIIENAILKKDNIIMGLKKKLEKYNDFEEGRISNFFDKEILVVEPALAINNLHDELTLYKNCYENLTVHFKQNKMSLLKYESLVNVSYNTQILLIKIKNLS